MSGGGDEKTEFPTTPRKEKQHFPAVSPVSFSGPGVVQRHLESLMADSSRLLRTCRPLSQCAVAREDVAAREASDGSLRVADIVECVRVGLADGTLLGIDTDEDGSVPSPRDNGNSGYLNKGSAAIAPGSTALSVHERKSLSGSKGMVKGARDSRPGDATIHGGGDDDGANGGPAEEDTPRGATASGSSGSSGSSNGGGGSSNGAVAREEEQPGRAVPMGTDSSTGSGGSSSSSSSSISSSVSSGIVVERPAGPAKAVPPKLGSRKIARHSLRNVRDAARRVIYDLTSSPLERAQRRVRDLITTYGAALDAPARESMQEVLRIVSLPPSSLAQPSFMTRFERENWPDMDVDTRKFLMTQMSTTPSLALALETLTYHRARPIAGGLGTEGADCELDPGVHLNDESGVRELLKKSEELDFDVFDFSGRTGHLPLQSLGYAIITNTGLCEELKVDRGKLGKFLDEIERRYRPELENPYHNAIHASDVLQTAHSIMTSSGLAEQITPLQLFSVYIAAIIHDVDHPGKNNAFQVATSSDFAINFNDQSVLENHSLAVAFRLIRDDTMDITSSFSVEDRRSFRATVIALVLATDIGKHFDIMAELSGAFPAPGAAAAAPGADEEAPPSPTLSTERPPVSQDSVLLVLKAVIKCADISNPAKPIKIYLAWVDRVMEEFWRQGDMEKTLGLPVSMFMDRDDTNVPKCQVGFINFIVKPLFMVTHNAIAIPDFIKNLDANLEHFKALAETKENNKDGAQ